MPANMSPNPEIECFTLGPWQTNCFVVTVPGSEACWIIDAGFDPEPLVLAVRERGLKPLRLILTHAHIDHIAGVEEILATLGDMPIAIHEDEKDFPGDPMKNLSAMAQIPITAPDPTETLVDGQTLDFEGTSWQVFHTPGHSPGGITLYHAGSGQAIVGDTLFAGSIGRHDFPTSDGPTLFRSIKEKLLTLPGETKIYPGHGPTSTIGYEERTNPFLVAAFDR